MLIDRLSLKIVLLDDFTDEYANGEQILILLTWINITCIETITQ